MELAKEFLSSAGEYAVASELCRMGMYAQLTLGTRKKTDILVDTGQAMWRIQVKTKNVRNWPFCKGIFGENIILVFVDYERKKTLENPDYYVLTSEDWNKLVRTKLRTEIQNQEVILDQDNCPVWRTRSENKKGNKGMDVLPEDVKKYRGLDKIKGILFSKNPKGRVPRALPVGE